MFVPPVLHVLPLTTIRRQRTLPVPGRITVELNQRVRPRDIVAEAEIAPRHQFIDLSRILGVDPREVSLYLTRGRDERVENMTDENQEKDVGQLSFEEAIVGLTDIVDKIEQGRIPLQDSLDQYEKGMALIKHCRTILQAAEQRIEKITKEQEDQKE